SELDDFLEDPVSIEEARDSFRRAAEMEERLVIFLPLTVGLRVFNQDRRELGDSRRELEVVVRERELARAVDLQDPADFSLVNERSAKESANVLLDDGLPRKKPLVVARVGAADRFLGVEDF